MIRKVLFAFLLTLPSLCFAQLTGDFVISFPSADTSLTRDSISIHFHVPNSYDGSTPFKLILGVHGLGDPDNSMQIRNYLSQTGDSVGAIVMCPDPYLGDYPSSLRVLDIALDSVPKWFNLDTNEYYIAGYSAGSDVAANYLLQENPMHKMKGLIWYAPGFFYVPDLRDKIDFPPTCLCVGDSDLVSTILGQVDAIRDSFSSTNIPFLFREIAMVAHSLNTIAHPQINPKLMDCINFIDDPENFVLGLPSFSDDFNIKIYPNPLEPGSVFSYHLKSNSTVKVSIYNIQGRVIKHLLDEDQAIGKHTISLAGFNHDLKSGTYFVRFELNGVMKSYKVMVVR